MYAYNQTITSEIAPLLMPAMAESRVPVLEKLAAEGGEDFFTYIEWLGLERDLSSIVIPSFHHYYWEAEDLKDVKTLINLKQLNYFKQIRYFLRSVYQSLAQNSYFLGSFIDRKNHAGFFFNSRLSQNHITGDTELVKNRITSKRHLINVICGIIDSRPCRYLDGRAVRLMLEDSSLKVVDMTEMKGLTYFCAQKTLTV